MPRSLLLVPLFALIPTLAACGAAVGCDFRDGSVNGPEDRCQERLGLQTFGFGEFCETLQGEAVEGGCPDQGKVLGCGQGADVIDWYYEPMTREEAETECADDDGTVIEP